MANTQKAIDDTCKYRDVQSLKKGTQCIVDGKKGVIWGGNSAANFNVKYDDDGRIRNCHPYWRMKILNNDGSVLYEHKD